MSHSNSSLNTFANCMARYDLIYNKHCKPDVPPSVHLTFGAMAHEVLEKAGRLRDNVADGIVDNYYSVIPSEVLYNDLKEAFKIDNWFAYFNPIVKQVAEYERDIVNNYLAKGEQVNIEREIKLELTPQQLSTLGYNNIHSPVLGIIDLLILTPTSATILDYKFSSNRKTQDDFDMNSQLQLYAMFVHILYDIPLHNITVGYIDIPKKASDKPILLSNGTLSRAKSQNITAEKYKEYVKAVHGDDPVYNCEPNGYYFDAYCNFMLNKPAYLSTQYVDMDSFSNITDDLLKAAQMIDFMNDNKLPFLKKYDSYSCKGCDYLSSCKPWLFNVIGE